MLSVIIITSNTRVKKTEYPIATELIIIMIYYFEVHATNVTISTPNRCSVLMYTLYWYYVCHIK